MEHDLLVAVVAVVGFGAGLPVSHVQPSAEAAGTTKSVSDRIFSITAEARPSSLIQIAAGVASVRGGIYCLQTTLRCSPFKVVQLDFLSQELQEFYKGRTLVIVSKQLFL